MKLSGRDVMRAVGAASAFADGVLAGRRALGDGGRDCDCGVFVVVRAFVAGVGLGVGLGGGFSSDAADADGPPTGRRVGRGRPRVRRTAGRGNGRRGTYAPVVTGRGVEAAQPAHEKAGVEKTDVEKAGLDGRDARNKCMTQSNATGAVGNKTRRLEQSYETRRRRNVTG